jgi:hypothetical protein
MQKRDASGIPLYFADMLRPLFFNLHLLFHDHLALVRTALRAYAVREDIDPATGTGTQVGYTDSVMRSSHSRF